MFGRQLEGVGVDPGPPESGGSRAWLRDVGDGVAE